LPFQTLALLLERPGEIVGGKNSKKALVIDTLWTSITAQHRDQEAAPGAG